MKVLLFCFVSDGGNKNGFYATNNRVEKLIEVFIYYFFRGYYGIFRSALVVLVGE